MPIGDLQKGSKTFGRARGLKGEVPSALAYRMPAEWEPHEATWLAWPHDRETWLTELSELEAIYVEIIEYLHLGEKVHILVQDAKTQGSVSRKLRERGITKNIFLHRIKTDSPWIRDYGPIFIVPAHLNPLPLGGGEGRVRGLRGQLGVTNWVFNAWGGKYKPFDQDNLVPIRVAGLFAKEEFSTEMVLEGGSIDVNGLGTCMTTEACLLNSNRNPGFGREAIEARLHDFLGIKHIIWLEKGIEGDDTDGHVDEIARFVDSKTVVLATEGNPEDENRTSLKKNWEILSRACDQDGNKLSVVPLPMPERVVREKMRLPASYANFYVANQCVLVPVFGDENDTKALGILESLFSTRRVVGISAIPLIYGQGGIHCITQQEPVL
ncbi:MAG: agmatine deiminase family protein [Candidatus Omnitrophica bacterium]|nr:agmatine deiminase family protein [Candidatus Omnitrophota bacterium]